MRYLIVALLLIGCGEKQLSDVSDMPDGKALRSSNGKKIGHVISKGKKYWKVKIDDRISEIDSETGEHKTYPEHDDEIILFSNSDCTGLAYTEHREVEIGKTYFHLSNGKSYVANQVTQYEGAYSYIDIDGICVEHFQIIQNKSLKLVQVSNFSYEDLAPLTTE